MNNTELNYFKNDNLNELFNCDIILYISIGNHDTSTPRRHNFLRRVPGTPPLCCQLPQLYRGDLHTPTEHEQNSRNEIDLLFFSLVEHFFAPMKWNSILWMKHIMPPFVQYYFCHFLPYLSLQKKRGQSQKEITVQNIFCIK